MCSSSPKPPKAPPPAPPPPSPEVIDAQAMQAADKERRRQRLAYGRRSTILAGSAPAPTGAQKTLLGS